MKKFKNRDLVKTWEVPFFFRWNQISQSFICFCEGKKVAKGKEKPKEVKLKPSDGELKNAICEILKEVDFNTVRICSLSDVVK